MILLNDLSEIKAERHAVTLGKFDGLHTAHAELIEHTVGYAREHGIASLVCSFDISPTGILTWEEKAEMAARLGADILLRCPFDEALIHTDAAAFIKDILIGTMHAAYVCVGEDFRFGFERRGTAGMLKENPAAFSAEVIPERLLAGNVISSSAIRGYLDEGRTEEANAMLGYAYFLAGEVRHGAGKGHAFGFPTANLIPPANKYLPAFGVYATVTEIDGKTFPGITNLGRKPTVDGSYTGAETNLFGYDGDLYGKCVRTSFLHFVRPERKFESVEALRCQVGNDILAGKAYFDKC